MSDNDTSPAISVLGDHNCSQHFWLDVGDPSVKRIIATGYACVMVILAIGFVTFTITMSVLAFFHPQQVSLFLTLYAVPVLTLLGVYGVKAKNAWLLLERDN